MGSGRQTEKRKYVRVDFVLLCAMNTEYEVLRRTFGKLSRYVSLSRRWATRQRLCVWRSFTKNIKRTTVGSRRLQASYQGSMGQSLPTTYLLRICTSYSYASCSERKQTRNRLLTSSRGSSPRTAAMQLWLRSLSCLRRTQRAARKKR